MAEEENAKNVGGGTQTNGKSHDHIHGDDVASNKQPIDTPTTSSSAIEPRELLIGKFNRRPKRARTAEDEASVKRQRREEYRANVQSDQSKGIVELPRKRFYRQRAHANPFSDHALDYPVSPQDMDWSAHYPHHVFKAGDAEVANGSRRVGQLKTNIEVADIGCGFGGLLFALAPKMPESLLLGLEIRVSVTEFVENKIRALRHQSANGTLSEILHEAPPQDEEPVPTPSSKQEKDKPPPQPTPHFLPLPTFPTTPTYTNIAAHRTNTMKFLPNFFPPQSLSSIFLCFPDPHFKARKHKARIVSPALCAEYYHVLRPGGMVYTITDVEDLDAWMRRGFESCRGFREVVQDEWEQKVGEGGEGREGQEGRRDGDWKVGVMWGETEEGKKVGRNGGMRFVGVWERLETPAWPGEDT